MSSVKRPARRSRADHARAKQSATLAALRAESERDLVAMIRRLLALPMAERTQFLRVRLPGGGSAL